MHESILVHGGMRYVKLALALVVITLAAYAIHEPLGGRPNGGTWLGYTLGVLSAAIMIWLSWLGVRKRSYGTGRIPLSGWLSAHVYLGFALALIATLHAGFQFGANVHTALYVLMMATILSGAAGLYFYTRYPRLLAANRRGQSTEMMLTQLAEIDRDIQQLGMNLDDDTNEVALRAVQETAIGTGLRSQLSGHDHRCPTTLARRYVETQQSDVDDTHRRQLLARLVRKEELLIRVRRDVQLRAYLQVWLYVHVPCSMGALSALAIHVVSVFYYW